MRQDCRGLSGYSFGWDLSVVRWQGTRRAEAGRGVFGASSRFVADGGLDRRTTAMTTAAT